MTTNPLKTAALKCCKESARIQGLPESMAESFLNMRLEGGFVELTDDEVLASCKGSGLNEEKVLSLWKSCHLWTTRFASKDARVFLHVALDQIESEMGQGMGVALFVGAIEYGIYSWTEEHLLLWFAFIENRFGCTARENYERANEILEIFSKEIPSSQAS